MTRRRFLQKGMVAGASLTLAGSLLGRKAILVEAANGVDRITWISPRGNLEVMDDYNLWVADQLGYFKRFNLDVRIEPGPLDALATTRFVATGQADIGFPAPGVLTSSIDSGMPVVSGFQMFAGQVFSFAVPADSPITDVRQLEGKTIALGSAGWEVIVAPMLVELGIDPNSVKYLNAGAQWGQAVDLGQADAALTWEALRAQWDAQGLKLRYFLGQDWSSHPSNSYCVRRSDLQDARKRDALVRFLKANVMAMEFTQANPRAAAQITFDYFPELAKQMTPQVALESMRQLAYGYAGSKRMSGRWGWHPEEGWQHYLDTIYELGQTQNHLKVDQVLTNELVEEVNSVDLEPALADAAAYQLRPEWEATSLQGPI